MTGFSLRARLRWLIVAVLIVVLVPLGVLSFQHTLREVDEFISPSEFLRDRYVEWGVPAAKIRVEENVLRQHPPAMRRHRTPGVALRVAFFGQLSPLKGIEVFIRAARKLEKTGARVAPRCCRSSFG